MLNDPIVTEIHQARRRIMQECHDDLELLLDRIRKREVGDAERVVSSVEEGRKLLQAGVTAGR